MANKAFEAFNRDFQNHIKENNIKVMDIETFDVFVVTPSRMKTEQNKKLNNKIIHGTSSK